MVGPLEMEEFRKKKQKIKETLWKSFRIEELPLTSQIRAMYAIQANDTMEQIEQRHKNLEEYDRLFLSYYFLVEWLEKKDNEGRKY